MRFDEIKRPGISRHLEGQRTGPHEPGELFERHPLADGTPGQRFLDAVASLCGEGHGPLAPTAGLALDVVDAAELVEQRVPYPSVPQMLQRIGGRGVQRGTAGLRQRQLRAARFGEPACLKQPGPSVAAHGSRQLIPTVLSHLRRIEEVAAVQQGGDALRCCGGRASGLRADADQAPVRQPKHGQQVVCRSAFHVAPHKLHLVALAGIAPCHVTAPALRERRRGFGDSRDFGVGRRLDKRAQAPGQVGRDDDGILPVPRSGIQEQPQGRGPSIDVAPQPVRELAVLGMEPILPKHAVRVVQRLGDRVPLRLVKIRPHLAQRFAGEMFHDRADHVRLAYRIGLVDRKQLDHRREIFSAQRMQGIVELGVCEIDVEVQGDRVRNSRGKREAYAAARPPHPLP